MSRFGVALVLPVSWRQNYTFNPSGRPSPPPRRCSLLTAPTAASRKLQPEWLEACYHGQFSFSKRRNR
jgi:hypothetical protein